MGKKKLRKKIANKQQPVKQNLFPFFFVVIIVVMTIVLSLILSYTGRIYDIRSKAAESIKTLQYTDPLESVTK